MAIRINAAADYLRRTASLPSNTAFTYILDVVIVSDVGAAAIQPICGVTDAGLTDGYGFYYEYTGLDGIACITSADAGVATNYQFASRPAVGTAFTIYLRCSGSGANLFDGGWRYANTSWVKAVGTLPATVASPTTFHCGSLAGFYYSNCRVQNLKIFDRALSDAELLAESQSVAPVDVRGLNLYCPLTHSGDLIDRGPFARALTRGGSLETEPLAFERRARNIFAPKALYSPPPAPPGNFFNGQFFGGGFFGDIGGSKVLVGTGTLLTLSPGSAPLKVSRIVVGTGTALTATPGTAILKVDRKLTATGTLLTLTGGNAGFNFVRGMSGTGTLLTLSGGTALPRVDRKLVATGTALAIAGGNAAFSVVRALVGTGTALDLTGGNASLRVDRRLTGTGAALALVGGTAALKTDRILVGTGTALALTGGTALLRADRVIVATGTLLTLSGGNATLEKSGAGSKTLIGTGTALTLSPGTAALKVARVLVGTGTALAASGGTALPRISRILVGSGTALAATGGTAALRVDRILSGEAGILALFGGNATLTPSGAPKTLDGEGTALTLSGGDATFTKSGGAAVSGPTPAGGVAGKRRKRKVLVGDKMYEVDSLKDVEFLLKRIVRQEPIKAPVVPRKRVVDRVSADVVAEAPVALEIPSIAVDWSPLYQQLAMQDAAYADLLAKVLEKQEEDDLETLLLLL